MNAEREEKSRQMSRVMKTKIEAAVKHPPIVVMIKTCGTIVIEIARISTVSTIVLRNVVIMMYHVLRT